MRAYPDPQVPPGGHGALLLAAALAAAPVAAGAGVPGLAERPVNETCVAPDRPIDGGGFPELLSQTGCFLPGAPPTEPAPGLIPYAPVSPLWTDGAAKRRWIAMPDWRQPGSTVDIGADGDFRFPIGTVLVKEFSLGARRVETRLLVRHEDGFWGGYTFVWDEAQTDATWLANGGSEMIGGQLWTYPASFDCGLCHNGAAGDSLGLEIAQLNAPFRYPSTGLVANQLETLESLGLFTGALPAPPAQLDALVDPLDATAPLVDRARAYLHTNCGQCHRPNGPGRGPEDFRYQIDGLAMGAYNAVPWLGDAGVPGALLLAPGEPGHSVISLRMKALDFRRMPPLGSNVVDEAGVALIDAWIESGLGFGVPDSDGDLRADNVDNCSAAANPDQRDTDGDGLGNRCDADLDGDCVVGFGDLAVLRSLLFSDQEDADLDGDGLVSFADVAIMKAAFFAAPGPSGIVAACGGG